MKAKTQLILHTLFYKNYPVTSVLLHAQSLSTSSCFLGTRRDLRETVVTTEGVVLAPRVLGVGSAKGDEGNNYPLHRKQERSTVEAQIFYYFFLN